MSQKVKAVSKETIHGELATDEPTREELEEARKAQLHALEIVEKRGEELTKDLEVCKFFREIESDISDAEENTEVVFNSSSKSRKCLFNLSKEDFETLFAPAENSEFFFIGNHCIKNVSSPLKLYPTIIEGAKKTKITPLMKKICSEYRRRIDCVFIYYQDEVSMGNRRPSTLSFYADFLPDGGTERWEIPSAVPINVPFYVLLHFLQSGDAGPGYRVEYESSERSSSEIQADIKMRSNLSVPYASKYVTRRLGVNSFVLIKPLSRIPRFMDLSAA